jgi:hypothetical protein
VQERANIAANIERGLRDQRIDPSHVTMRLAKNIVQICPTPAGLAAGVPKTDVIFERYKGVSKPPDEPNRGMPRLAAQVGRRKVANLAQQPQG